MSRRSPINERARRYSVISPEALRSHDGPNFLKTLIDGTLPQAPICETLGFHLIEAEPSRAGFESLPDFRHYNLIGTVHAGLAATLLDSALGSAIFSTLTMGEGWTTIELKLNLVRSLSKDTGPVRAEGRIVHRGRTVATSEGDLKDPVGSATPTPPRPHGGDFGRRSQGSRGQRYTHATTPCMIFAAMS